MATLKINGVDQVEVIFGTLVGSTEGIVKASLYEGASIMADELRRETKRLKQNEPGKPREENAKKIYCSVTDLEKNELLASLGIMKFSYADGGHRTLIGFAGYGRRKTKKYPRGLPNPLLARSVSKPSSMRRGRRFTKIAVKNCDWQVVNAMREKALRMIDSIANQ